MTRVVSFDDDNDKSSLILLREFDDDKIGLSFEFEFIGILLFDDEEEHFCRLVIWFKS